MSLGYTMLDMAHHYEVIRGIQGDGTSNNAIQGLVRRVIAALSVVAVAIFAFRGVMLFAKEDTTGQSGKSDKAQKLGALGAQFVVVMIFLFGAWGIAALAGKLVQGVF